MQLVLDTNTVISGLLWGGQPGRLIDAAVAGRIQLVSSLPLLAELRGVLARDKFVLLLIERATDAQELFDGYAAMVEIVVPVDVGRAVPSDPDPDDDMVLATAIAAGANFIVSGDTHLLALAAFRSIPIVPSAVAVDQLRLS